MFNNQRSTTNHINNHDDEEEESPTMRDIHALDTPRSIASYSSSGENFNFTTISREFNALVLAGSMIRTQSHSGPNNLEIIGEDQIHLNEEISGPSTRGVEGELVTMERVKKEEAVSKINAWENAKIAKINNRFKREEIIIHGWEDKQLHKATSFINKVERKLEKRRAKAVEKMQNDIAKARRKAEERKASAEAKRGTKVARVMEIANFMRATGRASVKRSFF